MHDVRQAGLAAETQSPDQATELSGWDRWLQHPESLRLHRVFLQIHLWLGVMVGLYILLMSVTGSMIVFRNELEQSATLGQRHWRNLPDVDLCDRSDRLVARDYPLAAQLDRKSEIEFSARQLGSAQRTGILVFGFSDDVGNFRGLLFISKTFLCSVGNLRAIQAASVRRHGTTMAVQFAFRQIQSVF